MFIDFHVTCRAMPLEEAVRTASLHGYRAMAVNPGPDVSDARALRKMRKKARRCSMYADIDVFIAVKLAHLPPGLLPDAVRKARKHGATFVLGLGETISPRHVPPVFGSNFAAIESGVDVLLHPGLITFQDACLAAERGVALEISLHPLHALANGHVFAQATKAGAPLVFGTDATRSADFLPQDQIQRIALGAGMSEKDIQAALAFSRQLVGRARERA